MLNEILEFEAYVKSPESEKPRIQPKLLTNNFSEDGNLFGIERILIVIARGYIFSKCHQNEIYNSDGMVNNELLNDTRVILQRWCGFDFDESGLQIDRESISNWFEKYPEADGWLKQYWMFHCAKKTKKEEMWNTIERKWGEGLIEKDYAEDHITLDSVIANAINRGPLRERYMVLRKDRSATPAKKEKERFTYLYSMKPGKDGKIHSLQEKTREKLLKNIAMYLLSREYHPKEQKFILLYGDKLLGWYGLDDYKRERKNWYFPECVWENPDEKSIMEVYSQEKGWQFVKMAINQDFLEYFEFRIIDEKQIKDYDKSKYWIIKDMGHGQGSLKCI